MGGSFKTIYLETLLLQRGQSPSDYGPILGPDHGTAFPFRRQQIRPNILHLVILLVIFLTQL